MTQADFNKLKQLGVKTAIVKITQGTGYVNPAASKQIEYARKAGLNVAVYHYATFDNTSAGHAEGQHAANTMQNFGLSKDTLIFADMEDESTYSVNAQANLNRFWSALSANGFTNHAVYTGGSYLYRDAVIATVVIEHGSPNIHILQSVGGIMNNSGVMLVTVLGNLLQQHIFQGENPWDH